MWWWIYRGAIKNIWQFREHLKDPSPTYDHITGHSTTIENFSIVGREDQNFIRAIKEAIYERVNNPSLNRNRQIPSASHMGCGSVKHLRTQIEINPPKWSFHLPHGYNICQYSTTGKKTSASNTIFYMIATYRQITSATSRHNISLQNIGYNICQCTTWQMAIPSVMRLQGKTLLSIETQYRSQWLTICHGREKTSTKN